MVIAPHAQENTTIGQQAMQAALDELYGLAYDSDKTFDARRVPLLACPAVHGLVVWHGAPVGWGSAG